MDVMKMKTNKAGDGVARNGSSKNATKWYKIKSDTIEMYIKYKEVKKKIY